MSSSAMRPIRVLHLEDSPRDADIIGHKLTIEGASYEIEVADCREHFEAALARASFDVVLCDYNLPGYDGVSALKQAKEVQPDAPVIIISGTVGEEEAVRCLRAGATDYLLKGRLERLAPAVRRAIREAEERRRRAGVEAKLHERERWLSSIYQAVADMLFYVEVEQDGGYRLISVNPAFLETTGLEYDQVAGKRLEDVLPTPGTALEHLAQAIQERRVVRWEETSPFPKRHLTAALSVSPVFNTAGRCTHLVGAIHDITERRQLEAQLRQAQKMESVGRLAGGIAHDFNNLLTIINGMAEFALAQISDADRQLQQDLEEIRRAGERAATLTRQLLAFSRKQILTPQVIDLNATIAEMTDMLRRLLREDIDLVVTTAAPAHANVKADRGQIEQMIANLVVNARDAMPYGGTLGIHTSSVVLDEQFGRQLGAAIVPGRYLALEVNDTGTGMDDTTRRQVFEPFFTTKEAGKGTGLGLSTVYGIAKQSDGYITVESEVGSGSCFTIYLPQMAEAVVRQAAAPSIAPRHGTETILVVEDVSGLRRLISRTLESAGYKVLTAGSGEEALHVLERHREPIHVAITDVVMHGMSGRDLAEHLDQLRPDMKVIYMSGYTGDVILRHGVLDERVPFISKPFRMTDLSETIRRILDAPRRSGTNGKTAAQGDAP